MESLSFESQSFQNLALDQALLELVRQAPISEYDIITKFKQPPYSFFNDKVMSNSLSLFQTHFVLFNALYRLRDIGLAHQQYDIDIISSCITYTPFSAADKTNSNQAITHQTSNDQQAIEKLRTYYLDWNNFEQTTESNVNQLIDSFWQTMFSTSSIEVSKQNNQAALDTLELTSLPNKSALKRQYMKLCNIHHPDKGGDHNKFQSINLAYNYLKKHV